ncbi:MAG: FimV family protein [Candidatus Tectimicrobiota bacterium]
MWNVLRVVMLIIGLQLVLAPQVRAFAVGDLALYSRQGEPLVAEIPLLLDARERDKGIEVTLGSREIYQAEGVKRPPLIDVLTAVVVGTRDTIRLSSQVAIRDSGLPLLLAIRVGQVTIVKQYHLSMPSPAPALARPHAPLPTIAQVKHVGRPSRAGLKSPRHPTARPERYGPVERGDTLYSVARSLQASPDKVWQTVVLLWRANKNQFAAGNLHGLNVGTYLDVPPDLSESIATMRLAEAQDIVTSQWEEWQALQRLGTGKQRLIAAASRDPEAAIAAYGKRDAVGRREPAPQPTEKPVDKPVSQTVVLPVSKAGNMVSMTELQNVLQGLEERLMRRLTPTASPEFKGAAPTTTTFVSASELQASIQNLEERLTQRMQQMLLQASSPEPILVAQRASQPTLQLTPLPPAVDNTQTATMTLLPYLLILSNVLLMILVGALLWLWFRRRERAARMQRV